MDDFWDIVAVFFKIGLAIATIIQVVLYLSK